MKSVYFLLLLLTLTSCKDSQKRKISNLVNEWDGKEIVFPSNSVFTVQAKDTVDFPINNADYKIVAYVDSVGCMSCKLQLPRWKDFISEIDSLTGHFIPFVFYFHPKDIKELRYITRRDNFEYPICIDVEDKFNSLNHFPDKMEFQTFLIDMNNKVVAIGNPIHNSKYPDNTMLSLYRAYSVFTYLTDQKGFDASTMLATGRGESVPIASNATAEGRAQNRRVEIKIYNSFE